MEHVAGFLETLFLGSQTSMFQFSKARPEMWHFGFGSLQKCVAFQIEVNMEGNSCIMVTKQNVQRTHSRKFEEMSKIFMGLIVFMVYKSM